MVLLFPSDQESTSNRLLSLLPDTTTAEPAITAGVRSQGATREPSRYSPRST